VRATDIDAATERLQLCEQHWDEKERTAAEIAADAAHDSNPDASATDASMQSERSSDFEVLDEDPEAAMVRTAATAPSPTAPAAVRDHRARHRGALGDIAPDGRLG